MATGLSAQGSARMAIEVAEGDATTPTRLMYFPPGSLSIQQTIETIEDRREWSKGFDSTADVMPGMEDVTVTVTGVPLSFEDAGFLWCGLAKSGSAAGAVIDTTGYERTWTPSQTSSVVGTGIESFHLEYSTGDLIGTVGWSIPGLILQDLALHFRRRASGTDTGVTMDATFRSASGATQITAYTGSLADRTQSYALGQQVTAYVDDSVGGIGNTVDGDINELDLTVSRPVIFHDGMAAAANTHTSAHLGVAETSMTWLRRFSDKTELDKYIGAAFVRGRRVVRVEAVGALVGSSTAFNTIRADFFGKITDDGSIPELVDSMWYQRFSLTGLYDSTLTASVVLYTLNSVSVAYDTA